MTYNDTLEYLYNVAPAFEKVGANAYKEGLDNTHFLDEHFGHPHRNYHTIHVAGTNGKGSTSHTIAALLQAAGYRVGLYTSPHLVDFNERIRVNGTPIPHSRVIRFVEEGISEHILQPVAEVLPGSEATSKGSTVSDGSSAPDGSPTSEGHTWNGRHFSFFELTTALAFKYFDEQKVDFAVIEVGLGGRLDCTNIISPILSVITNISFDHTGFLGNTLAKIAGEKAGIIKAGVPVVIGEAPMMNTQDANYSQDDDVRAVFLSKAQSVGAPIRFAEYHNLVTPQLIQQYALKGTYQPKNLNTFLNVLFPLARAMKAIGLPLTKNGITAAEAVRRALTGVTSMTGLLGRWQTLGEAPHIVCDTGHNLAAWKYLAPQIVAEAGSRQLSIVFGMVDDKDIDGVLQLLPRKATYFFTQADTHRAIPVDKLTASALSHGLQGTPYPTVEEAFRVAKEHSTPDSFIFVGGSSYVVADLLTSL